RPSLLVVPSATLPSSAVRMPCCYSAEDAHHTCRPTPSPVGQTLPRDVARTDAGFVRPADLHSRAQEADQYCSSAPHRGCCSLAHLDSTRCCFAAFSH